MRLGLIAACLALGIVITSSITALGTSVETQFQNIKAAIREPAEAAPSSPKPGDQWTYSTEGDPMRDTRIETACTWSVNTINLPWPYTVQRARLCIRQHPRWGLDAYVALESKGQILCRSYEDCILQTRVDDAPAEEWMAVGPADNSATSFFFRQPRHLVRLLKSADRFMVEAPFYQAGRQTMIFDTRAFAWPRGSAAAQGKQRGASESAQRTQAVATLEAAIADQRSLRGGSAALDCRDPTYVRALASRRVALEIIATATIATDDPAKIDQATKLQSDAREAIVRIDREADACREA